MTLSALLTGFAIGAIVFSVLMLVVVRNVRKGLADDMARKDRELDEARREAADDRETNRRLRHEIHQLQSGRIEPATVGAPSESVGIGGYNSHFGDEPSWDADIADIEQTSAAHAESLAEIESLQRQLADANVQIAESDAKLKRYREALTEIRLSLEARDPLNNLVNITEEVPTTPPADAPSGAA